MPVGLEIYGFLEIQGLFKGLSRSKAFPEAKPEDWESHFLRSYDT